jgi:SAM-dependent methyltransferase
MDTTMTTTTTTTPPPHGQPTATATAVRTLVFPGTSGLPPLRLRCVEELPLELGLLLVEEEHEDWTGLKIWPGAHLLLAFLTHHHRTTTPLLPLHGRRAVVELGCGTGAVGLALGPLLDPGATVVVLTDGHPALVQLAAENVGLNYHHGDGGDGGDGDKPAFVARRLLWGDCAEARAQLEAVRQEIEGVDLVLAADCIYDAEVLEPLLWTAAQLLRGQAQAQAAQSPPAFVLSYCGRCLLSDSEFDRRIEAAAERVGLRCVSTTSVNEQPALAASLPAGMATALREANARVFVFEPASEAGGGGGDGNGMLI